MCRSLPTAGFFKVFASNCWIFSPISLVHPANLCFQTKRRMWVGEQVESTTCIARAWCIGISKQRMFYWPNGLRQPWWLDCIFVELVDHSAASFQWILGDIFLWVTKVLFVREGFKRMMSNFIVKPGCWADTAAKFLNFHVRTLHRLLLERVDATKMVFFVKGCSIWDDLAFPLTIHMSQGL